MIISITSDTDFVSDEILRYAYSHLNNIPCTFFITGRSEYVNSTMFSNKLWEVEPHPNFINGSSHGSSIDSVMESVHSFNTRGLGFRCHRYYFSNDVAELFINNGYKYSSNVCTDLQCVPPFNGRCGLIEFPIFFEDGGYLKYHGIPNFETIIKRMDDANGIYVFNFHPIHIALNSCDFNVSRRIKDGLSPDRYRALSLRDIASVRNTEEYGIADLLCDILCFASTNHIRILNLKQLYEERQNFDF